MDEIYLTAKSDISRQNSNFLDPSKQYETLYLGNIFDIAITNLKDLI